MSDEWDGLLRPNETILWQGAPMARVRFAPDDHKEMFGALFGCGFSIFWMTMASKAGGHFWMFGLFIFGISFYRLIGVHLWKAYKRKHQFYTLTNERAFVGTNLHGRKTLKGYPVEEGTPFFLEEGKYGGDVYFAQKETLRSKGRVYVERIGFEQIDDARHVYQLLSKIGRGET